MPALGYRVRRRVPPAGPMVTPGEHNQLDTVQTDTPYVSEKIPQSEVISRPSRRQIAFFLSEYDTILGAQDFLFGHETIPFGRRFPNGRLSNQDPRRNVAVPPRISYGSLVGEMDGVSPNGLD